VADDKATEQPGEVRGSSSPSTSTGVGHESEGDPSEQMNLDDLRVRLEGIAAVLKAHRDAGARLPSASKGNEREVLIREFLARVFPLPFRFGGGALVDANGASSGQVDIVVEFPFLPSFPTPGAAERLYLADSAALVIEVKSDLATQWKQVREKARRVSRLRRHWHAHSTVDQAGAGAAYSESQSRVPMLAVGYRGPRTLEALQGIMARTDVSERPDAALVLDPLLYSGCALTAGSAAGAGAGGLLAFCLDTAWLARNVVWAAPDVRRYLKAFDGSAG
jgi:hypothetical protein